jgi:LPS sulfotransferase NodH
MALLAGGDVATLHEPLIGAHLGLLSSTAFAVQPRKALARPRAQEIRTDDEYFFSERYRSAWQPALRRLMLQRFATEVPAKARMCVVHEPNGSEGADLIMSALPNSYLIFLLRDGRDVVDSALDARQKGSWADTAFGGVGEDVQGARRLELVEQEAYRWVTRTNVVARAFEQHDASRRVRVRYEELLADTFAQLQHIYAVLPLSRPADLEDRIAKLSFDAVPAEQRGSGRFHRAASPGLWRTNFSAEEQWAMQDIMGSTLEATGYEL